jgi:hypothetical protein
MLRNLASLSANLLHLMTLLLTYLYCYSMPLRQPPGRRVVVAPVTISGDTDAVYLFRGTASVRIRFSTAAFLGARFPLISPAGEIAFSRKQNLALVDGGYVDNTGTETLAALIREIGKAKTVRPFSLVVLIPKSIEKGSSDNLVALGG